MLFSSLPIFAVKLQNSISSSERGEHPDKTVQMTALEFPLATSTLLRQSHHWDFITDFHNVRYIGKMFDHSLLWCEGSSSKHICTYFSDSLLGLKRAFPPPVVVGMLYRPDAACSSPEESQLYIPSTGAESEADDYTGQEKSQKKKRKPTHWARDVSAYQILGPIGEGTYGKVRCDEALSSAISFNTFSSCSRSKIWTERPAGSQR